MKQYYDNANIKNHTKMADNWADLLDGSIDEPFAIDDSFTSYRTGSLEDGSISTKTCRNWTDNNAFDYGTLGSPQLNDSNWMQSSSTSHCANYLPILCLCMQTNENVADQYTVGGSVTGNTGDVVLSLNSGDQTITIAEGDSSYFFADALDDASTYTVTVTSSPSGQACLLENNTGSISGDSIRNVNVTCGSSTLTLGGALTGLTGTGTVTLSLNSGDQTKSLTANGSFSFDTLLDAGATYDVTVSSTPQYVDCTVTHGMGTITSTVSNITITCSGTKNFLFPTTSSYTAALTSRATVDGYCSATRTATYPTLPCRSVHAFISFGSSDEIRDMPSLYSTNTSLPILNAAHSYDLLANNWALLLDESALDHNLTVDWWSGSSTSGATSMFDCSTWTSTAHVRDASVGWGEDSIDFSSVLWTGTSDGYCDESHQIMCLCSQ